MRYFRKTQSISVLSSNLKLTFCMVDSHFLSWLVLRRIVKHTITYEC